MKLHQLKKIFFALILTINYSHNIACQTNDNYSLIGINDKSVMFSYQIIYSFMTSYIIHYAGQTCTNTLYTLLPKLQKSNLSIITSFFQYIVSTQIAGNTIKQMNISEPDFIVGHLLGSIIATCSLKPCEIYQEYFSKKILQKLNLPDSFTVINNDGTVTDENNNPCIIIKDKNEQLYCIKYKNNKLNVYEIDEIKLK